MLTDKKLAEILLGQNYLTAKDLHKIQQAAKEYNSPLADVLVAEGVMTKDLLGQALAEYYGVEFLNLDKEKIDRQLFAAIPEEMARGKRLAVINGTAGTIKLAMANPGDKQAANLVAKKLGRRIKAYFILPADLSQAWNVYRSSLIDEFAAILKKMSVASREEKEEATSAIVDTLLRHGNDSQASDIHIEPAAKKVAVRFRIDGVMHDTLTIDKKFLEPIVSRIKIMAKLRTDEHRSAQDGKLRYQINGQEMDVRVSIVPIVEGENVVLRLLSTHQQRIGLTGLGLAAKDLKKMKQAITEPHGMILVTGPTGSGKTTTLYAILNILNKTDVHIATIEDPVEYNIEGVSQIQVNAKTNLTFASGLRAILRQDPDIIMVGEIRDKETASIAVNSALTGHLVLSTLHTNDAPTALPRLIDLKVEPFLIASTVNVVVAQRLVRKNCERCRISYKLSADDLRLIDNEPRLKEALAARGVKNLSKLNFYRGQGCPVCGQTGFSGRIGIFEILLMSDELKELVTNKAASNQIMKTAKAQGMTTMLADGLDKVFSGITTLEEVLRVALE